MTQQVLVSVIIPIYNVEKYLDRCVESVLEQTYRNIEIILVDDGSTDRSGRLCDIYAERDRRIKVIHKENGGLSDARNAGVQNSKGKYIAFIDSDDYVHAAYVQRMVEKAEQKNCDIVICGYIKKHEDGRELVYCVSEEIYDGRQIQKKFYAKKNFPELYDIACNKLYPRRLLERIPFPKGRIHEDMLTNYKILYQCQRIGTIRETLYYYMLRDSSISRNRNLVERHDRIAVEKERMEFYGAHGEHRMFLLAQKAYYYLALTYARDIVIPQEEKARYREECAALSKKMLCSGGYSLMEKAGIVLTMIRKRGKENADQL